jgi:hypothetical protein
MIEHGDGTYRGITLSAHFPPRSRFSVEQSRSLSHLDRCETEDICVNPIHSCLDSMRFCVVSQQERWIVDHDDGGRLPLSHPFQSLRSSLDDVSRTISDFAAAESAPSNILKFLSLLSLGSILLNLLLLPR